VVPAVLSRRVRVCLLTGGGYPYRRDALGGWCRTLVGGLTRYTFDLLTLTDRERPAEPAYPLPAHVASASAALFTGPPRRRICSPDEATDAAVLLCRGLLHDGYADDLFAEGLRRLAVLAVADEAPLHGVPLADVLLEAWRVGRGAPTAERLPLPRLSVRDARAAAALLRHVVRALAVRAPDVDLVHCVGGTAPLLAALACRWRTGTPLLLTEARAPIGRHRAGEERLSPVVRTVLRRFRRSVARTGYAEAGLIAPLSTYHHGWALRHGARPNRLVAVPAGVDPRDHPAIAEPTGAPAVVWTGSGGPDSGLAGLLDAFADVVAAVPSATLHLTAVLAAHRPACDDTVERSGLGWAVRVGAPAPDRYAVGHVVVHVPGPADPPYRLIEAMMSGRPVIGVDAGPVAETLGDAGVVVPADDPVALATACTALLRSDALRRELGDAARRRALTHFTADRVVRAYDALYADLTAPPPAPSYELALAARAPLLALPTTVRWLAQEER
jgi:glycosyltransferase involved in cell wall biosynthesis